MQRDVIQLVEPETLKGCPEEKLVTSDSLAALGQNRPEALLYLL